MNLLKIPMDTKKREASKKLQALKYKHVKTDSDNDLGLTPFPKFIVLESTEDTPIT